MERFYLLHKNDLPGEIEIHTDLLSDIPSALSRRRADKTNTARQDPKVDADGPAQCVLCHPDVRAHGSSRHQILIEDRVASFENDFPYLPRDHHVVFLWHSSEQVREDRLHRFQLKDFGRSELYWLLKGITLLESHFREPSNSCDIMRMVAGFNLGDIPGQSIPHFHAQCGWEVVLNKQVISKDQMNLYFDELGRKQLVLHGDSGDAVTVVSPWTPRGAYGIDLFFNGKHSICEIDENDISIFATFGHRIIQKYLCLGIQNLNIIFSSSPRGKTIHPLMVRFIPRLNKAGLYTVYGVNIVDRLPEETVQEFRRVSPGEEEKINWAQLMVDARAFAADQTFEDEGAKFASRPNALGQKKPSIVSEEAAVRALVAKPR